MLYWFIMVFTGSLLLFGSARALFFKSWIDTFACFINSIIIIIAADQYKDVGEYKDQQITSKYVILTLTTFAVMFLIHLNFEDKILGLLP